MRRTAIVLVFVPVLVLIVVQLFISFGIVSQPIRLDPEALVVDILSSPFGNNEKTDVLHAETSSEEEQTRAQTNQQPLADVRAETDNSIKDRDDKNQNDDDNRNNNDAPPKTKQEPEKFLTYGRFPGRLNNQLFNFVAGLQHAVALNRTLIVPPETTFNKWTGMFDKGVMDIWDLSSLNANYKLDWTTASQKEVNVSKDCFLNPNQQRNLLLSGSKEWDHCPVLQIGGHGGLMFCKQHHRFCGTPAHEKIAFDIFPHIRISKAFQQFLPTKQFSIGVHSRTIGGDPPYPSLYCITQVHKVTDSHIPRDLWANHNTNATCAAYCSLWTNLGAQLSPAYREKFNKGEQFFLASDGSYDWSQNFKKEEYYMIDFDPMVKWLESAYDAAMQSSESHKDTTSPYLQELMKPGQKRRFLSDIRKVASAILDIYALVIPPYFVSCPISTVAMTVCLLRGLEKKYDSNVCWMLLHPDSLHAVFPKYLVEEGKSGGQAVAQRNLRAAPTPPPRPTGKILTYGRYVGRLNNQIFNFVSALQYATVLNCTLVVPPETQLEHWTGFVDGRLLDIWDLSSLNQKYRIDWNTALSEKMKVPKECNIYKNLKDLVKEFPTTYKNCPVVHLSLRGGTLWCDQQHRFCGTPEHERIAFDILRQFKLSKTMQKYVPKQNIPIGVHSRVIGGKPPYPSLYCIEQVHKATSSHTPPVLLPMHDSNTTCAEYCSVWTNLRYQLSPKFRPQFNSSTPFFLASDRDYNWSHSYPQNRFYQNDYEPMVNEFMAVYDAAKINKTEDRHGLSPYMKLRLDQARFIYHRFMRELTSAVLDMYTLVQADYFVGNPISTVSITVCLLRGEEQKYDSNVCWMLLHPDSKYAVFPDYKVEELKSQEVQQR